MSFINTQPSLRKTIARMLIIGLISLHMPAPIIGVAKAADVPSDRWVNVPVKNDPMMQGLSIPANATVQGMWSSSFNWPMNGLHSMVLPDGKLLTFGTTADGNAQDGRTFDVWDPSLGFGANSHNTSYQAQQQDSFCSTATYLNDGRLLITGGNANNGGFGNGNTIYNPINNSRITPTASTALPRWYSTMITLPDSRKIIMGGMKPYTEGMFLNPDQAIANGEPSMTPEIYENGAWRSLFGANNRDAFGPDFLRTSFPHAFVAPNGQVFGISAEKMWYLDVNANGGNGAITYVGNFKRGYGNMADPVNVGALSVTVMYDIGKILHAGGNGGFNGDGFPSSNMATLLDINNGAPVLTELPRMNFPRRYGNGIVLANGQVVITGGTRFGNDGGSNAVYAAEIWNPNTNQWTVGANAEKIRVYHSQTSLLPNGAIISTGGGTPGPVLNLNAEVYYPPYLFKPVGGGSQLATRPVIKAISGLSYNHNDTIQLDMATDAPIASLALIGISNGTHSFNNGQRRIPLNFTQNAIRLTSTIPNANLAPPGYYQVVALDAAGVPSYGAIIGIGQNVMAPSVPVTPYTPPDLSGSMNLPVINAGGTAAYTTAAINGYTYRWNFGDGSPSTTFSTNPNTTHTFNQAGVYVVTLSVRNSQGIVTNKTWLQAVSTAKTTNSPTHSSPIVLERRTNSSNRVWVVNPDNDSVSVVDDTSKALVASIDVGVSPRTLAVAPDGRIWVANKGSATISIINPTTLSVVQTINLPRASQPHGLIFAPNGDRAYVVLEATGQVIKFDNQGVQLAVLNVGQHVRHIANTADNQILLVSRFITPPLSGESTATVDTSTKGGEVVVVNAAGNMAVSSTITLRHSDKLDNEIQGAGVPNYLAAPVISPDGTNAWVPSKQDNIKRGVARNGQNLDFQNTVRAISSNIDMTTLSENYAKRVDHDNSSVGSAAVYHPNGAYLFVALETSREVEVLDAIRGTRLFRFNVGRAPQGLVLSADGNTLYVHEFMDRSVSAIDLKPLTQLGQLTVNSAAVTYTVVNEKLPANVILGKQLFYDAKDPRLARDSYMSCASCHNDAGSDGRVWDLTGFGEGLRNTIALKGRAAMGHGFLHWSANFDELQDFEKQIRDLAGGAGLMTDVQFNTGTRNQPLGDKKAGISADLDNLAAYVASLNKFAQSPKRNADGTLTASAMAGKTVFNNTCASCHSGNRFTNSQDATTLTNIATINSLSGKRLASTLTGIDVPTLRDVWSTAPYLHNGSAATIAAAVQAHKNINLYTTDLANVVAYLEQIGGEEVVNGGSVGTWKFNEGNGNNVADASGNNHPLTLTNGTWVTGVSGQSVKFNGANTAASTTVSILETAGSFTVSAWVKLDNLNGWQTFVNQDGVNVSGFWLQYSQYVNNNKFMLSMHDLDNLASAPYRAVSTTTPVVGEWYHLVGVRDKTAGTMKIYVNGKLEGTTAYTGGWAANGSLNVGRGKYGGPNDWVAGAIDEVGAYNYALSDAEVAALYTTSRENIPPTVTLTLPTNNSTSIEGASITLSANASDSDGSVTQVQFFDGAILIGSTNTAPYTYTWNNAAPGTHTITAQATDNSGAIATSAAITIIVNPVVSNQSPMITLNQPITQDVTNRAGYIQAIATDSDGSIAKVEFYYGNTLLYTASTAPFTVSWGGVANGTYVLTAKAYDNQGATKTSNAVTIVVNSNAVANNTSPTVSLGQPVATAGNKSGYIEASASDQDGFIARVEFYYGNTLLSTSTTAPYRASWTNVPNGSYALTAKAYDNQGGVTTSDTVMVVVQ